MFIAATATKHMHPSMGYHVYSRNRKKHTHRVKGAMCIAATVRSTRTRQGRHVYSRNHNKHLRSRNRDIALLKECEVHACVPAINMAPLTGCMCHS